MRRLIKVRLKRTPCYFDLPRKHAEHWAPELTRSDKVGCRRTSNSAVPHYQRRSLRRLVS